MSDTIETRLIAIIQDWSDMHGGEDWVVRHLNSALEEMRSYDPEDDGLRVECNGEWVKPSKEFRETVERINFELAAAKAKRQPKEET